MRSDNLKMHMKQHDNVEAKTNEEIVRELEGKIDESITPRGDAEEMHELKYEYYNPDPIIFKKYICSFCDFRTNKKYNLDTHMKKKHQSHLNQHEVKLEKEQEVELNATKCHHLQRNCLRKALRS